MKKRADYWIDKLDLLQHPEGGFYKETYRSNEIISGGLPSRFEGVRCFSTAIYFLLRSEDTSLFHKIKSDEIWHFHAGSSLSLYVLQEGELKTYLLGSNPDNNETLQVVIPANCWFGAKVNENDSYVLSSCTVSPGFDFADFELAKQNELLQSFPAYKDIITKLT